MFRCAANGIICQSLKIKISSRECTRRLSPRRRGEDEGEWWICRAAGVVCLDSTLTLPLSLGKGEVTDARIQVISAPKNQSRVWETST
jgi:hypothetical protein